MASDNQLHLQATADLISVKIDRPEKSSVTLSLDHQAALELAHRLILLVADTQHKLKGSANPFEKTPFEQSARFLLEDAEVQTGVDNLGRVVLGFRTPTFPAVLVALHKDAVTPLRFALQELDNDPNKPRARSATN